MIKLEKYSIVFSVVVLATGLLVLLGWGFNVAFLMQPLKAMAPMNPMTACLFIFSGTALFLLLKNQDSQRVLLVVKILAVLVSLVATLRLIAVFNIYDFNIDILLFARKMEAVPFDNKPIRMAPYSAINFLLSGISLLLLSNKKVIAPQYIALFIAFTALLSIIGYTYGVNIYYELISYFPTAIHTIGCFLLLSMAILFSQSEKGFMAELTSPYAGGRAARVLLLMALLIPITMGLFRLYSEKTGLYSTGFATTLFATAIVIISVFLLWKTVASINKSQLALTVEIAERRKTEAALQKSLKEIADYKYAIDESSIVVITDEKGIITFVNDNFCNISKFSREELIGQDDNIISSGHHAGEFFGELRKTITSGKVWRGEIKNKGNDGIFFWLDTTIIPFVDEMDEPYQYLAICSDSTQRKELENEIIQFNQQLQKRVDDKSREVIEKEQQYRFLLENMKEGIVVIGYDWKYRFANNSFIAQTQLSAEELLDHTVMEKYPDIENTELFDVLNYCMKERVQQRIETDFAFPGGRKAWFELSIQPVVEGIFILSTDITDRKKAADEIKKYNDRFILLASTTQDAIWEWNLESNEFWANEMHQQLYDLNVSDPVPTEEEWLQRIHPDDRERIVADKKAAFASPSGVWVSEYRFKQTNGYYITIYDRSYIIRNSEGVPIRLMGSMMDITEQKKAEEKVRQSHQKYFTLMNSVDGIVWEADADTFEFSFVSQQAERLLGYPVEQWINDPTFWAEHIYEEDRKWAVDYCIKCTLEKRPHEFEYRMVAADGKIVWLRDIVSIRAEPNGDVKLSGVMIDITEQKLDELLLKQLNEKLEKKTAELRVSNTELERFAYVASHDLQEPMRMVGSFMKLLEKRLNGQLDETTKQYIHFAVDGAERMSLLIQALLEYSKIGTYKEDFAPVDLNEVMHYVNRLLEQEIKRSDAEIKCGSLPIIAGNKTLISQVFINLISNALKYCGDKNPKIEVGYIEERSKWTFYIKDNGIGIEPKFFHKIFVIFQRLHHRSDYSGTGIGLAVCKKIVETHKGLIWVESEPGKGSTFYFTIPKQHA